MDEILKGNFQVKKPVAANEDITSDPKETLSQTLKKRVLGSLGGSMVYVERDMLNWDGHEQSGQ